MSPNKRFPGHFRSSPSSAEPTSNQPSTIGTRRLATRPRMPGRGARTTKLNIPPKDGRLNRESPSEPHHTAGSCQGQSSPDVVQESIPSVPIDSEETGGTPDARQSQPHNKGGYSSAFTPYIALSTDQTLWDVTNTVVSSHEQQLGKIYVYRDPNSEDSVYKVGVTKRLLGERLGEHKNCCKFVTERVYEPKQDIENSYRLEALIGWDLGHYRMRRACHNRVQGHEEWFAASKEVVVQTVKQWEDFMVHEQPYDAQGNLRIIWRYLFKHRSPKAADIRKLCAKTRRREWAAILASPTCKDYAYAYLSHAGSELTRFRGWKPVSYWQLSTVIYSLWTLALSRNVVAFYALIIVLGCAGNALLPESQFHDEKEKSKRRRSNSPKKDSVSNLF